MKFFLVLALVGVAAAGRLENTYLPPTHAASSGGSAGALQAPYAGAASNSASRFGGGAGSGSGFGGAPGFSSGSGSGFNAVRGSGSGYNAGSGSGSGYNAGSGSGSGYNAGSGSGSGYNAGSGSGSGYNAGSGSGSGYNAGSASGSGYSSGGRQQAPAAILKYSNDNNGEGAYQYSFETENGIAQQESGSLRNAGTDSEANVVTGSYSYTDSNGQVITVNYVADENGFRAEGAHLPTPPPIPEAILRSLEQNAAEEAAGNRGGVQNGYPTGAASNNNNAYNNNNNNNNNAFNSKPNNAYIPPVQSARRPGFNQKTGYNY